MPRHLTQTIQYMLEQNIRHQTSKNYNSANNHYISFCNKYNLPLYPIDQEKYMYYIADSLSKLKAKSIKTYMSGINYHARINGFPIQMEKMPNLQNCKQALSKVFDAQTKKERKPYLWEHFIEDYQRFDFEIYDNIVYFTALAGGLISMMRPSEYLAKKQNVSFDSNDQDSMRVLYFKNLQIKKDINGEPNYCVLTCRLVKTAKNYGDVEIVWPRGKWPLSPTDWIIKMIVKRHKLARTIPHLEIKPKEFLFKLKDGKVLTTHLMTKFVKKLIKDRDWPEDKYPLLAVKDGGVTSLGRHGAPMPTVRKLGRWLSDAYEVYINESHQDVANQLHLYTQQPVMNPNLVYLYNKNVGYILKQ